MAERSHPTDAAALDFAPAIRRAQHENAAPLPRAVLYIALALFAVMLAWACFGRLDIIAVAQGKLIPGSYVKIVQPADSGIVREILVKDGQEVEAGQVLMRMDTQVSDADSTTVDNDLNLRRLQLRRIQAELNSAPFEPVKGDPPAMLPLRREAQPCGARRRGRRGGAAQGARSCRPRAIARRAALMAQASSYPRRAARPAPRCRRRQALP